MEKIEIDKEMKGLLKQLLDKEEFDTLEKLVENKGNFDLSEEE